MQENKESIQLGGYTTGWSCGSLWENEGLYLYNMVRNLKPKKIVEIGTHDGCSTSWLAAGCRDNGFGKVISYDVRGDAGNKIDPDLMEYIELRNRDALECEPEKNIDLLFEDGQHNEGFTYSVLRKWKAKTVVVHDYMHRSCQDTVKKEFDQVLGEPDIIYFEEPSDCGLAIKYCDNATKKGKKQKGNKKEY